MSTVEVVAKIKTDGESHSDRKKPVSAYRSKKESNIKKNKPTFGSKKPFTKGKPKAKTKIEPPRNIIYGSIELTSGGSSDAKIVQFNLVIPDTKPGSVDYKRESILCNNAGVEISDEAIAYHGITKEMVANKPLAKDVTLPTYGYIALWDGYVGNILLNTNAVAIRKGSLVDLHKLLRFTKDHASHRITLKKASIEATKDSFTPEQIEGFLADSENKVLLLPIIMDYIRKIYADKFDITDLGSLARLSRQPNKKAYLETLNRIKEHKARKDAKAKKRKFPLKKKANTKRTPGQRGEYKGTVKQFPRHHLTQEASTIKAVA